MPRSWLCVWVLLSVGLVLPAASYGQTPPQPVRDAELTNAVEGLLNDFRHDAGRSPLRRSTELRRAATSHATDMATLGYFSHTSPGGSTVATRLRDYGPRVGEVIYWRQGQLDATAALAAWLASPEHRRLVLSQRWRDIGVAVVYVATGPGSFGGRPVSVAVVEFGRRS